MSSQLISIIKYLYQDDKYILIDRDKRATVQPTRGVKQGCPLSPLLFSIYVNDIGCITEGETGAIAELCFWLSPRLAVSSLAFANHHNLANRLHALIWLLKTYAIPAGMYANQIWATPYLRQGTEMDNQLQRWILNVLRNLLGLKWSCATMRFYSLLTRCNMLYSLFFKKVLHADISLSSRTDSCWTPHLLSALDGLANSNLIRRRIMACDPVSLNQFVVDLRSRHLDYWNQVTTPDPRVNNSKRLMYHQWCALSVRDAHAIHPLYTMPKYKKEERLRWPSLDTCIKERSPALKGRAPPHRPRGRASTEVYSSKLAPTIGPTTRLSGRLCPASLRPIPKP
eukprot:1136605-Pelagomonas_calceolata.AAC.1